MTLSQIREVLRQTGDVDTIGMVYFEGGEPFLFYPIMVQGLREAAAVGLKRGIVTNCYWATSVEDALQWLDPIAEIGIDDLSLSSDLFHGEAMMTQKARNAIEAAHRLNLPESVIHIEAPAGCGPVSQTNKGEPITGGPVAFRGRAAAKLTEGVPRRPWTEFVECPSENFVDLGRVHVDAFGWAQICQGLTIGNLWQQPLAKHLCAYAPEEHPIIGPLAAGGPKALVERYDLDHVDAYCDACHLCYVARDQLRGRFPDYLAPAVVYGDP
jgi:hypothetical protein